MQKRKRLNIRKKTWWVHDRKRRWKRKEERKEEDVEDKLEEGEEEEEKLRTVGRRKSRM